MCACQLGSKRSSDMIEGEPRKTHSSLLNGVHRSSAGREDAIIEREIRLGIPNLYDPRTPVLRPISQVLEHYSGGPNGPGRKGHRPSARRSDAAREGPDGKFGAVSRANVAVDIARCDPAAPRQRSLP